MVEVDLKNRPNQRQLEDFPNRDLDKTVSIVSKRLSCEIIKTYRYIQRAFRYRRITPRSLSNIRRSR
jgi:hypothetical protein